MDFEPSDGLVKLCWDSQEYFTTGPGSGFVGRVREVWRNPLVVFGYRELARIDVGRRSLPCFDDQLDVDQVRENMTERLMAYLGSMANASKVDGKDVPLMVGERFTPKVQEGLVVRLHVSPKSDHYVHFMAQLGQEVAEYARTNPNGRSWEFATYGTGITVKAKE
ncbi:hypothetical protein ACFL0V_01955 [Nanoarchaeota archaeon]